VHSPLVLFAVLSVAACSSPVAEPNATPDPNAAPGPGSTCYTLHLGGTPAPDVTLPTVIELSRDPAPGFVDQGRFVVREPGVGEPRAPVSWWVPRGAGALELVLGGGFTGYTFDLMQTPEGDWEGEGIYCSDMGVLPAPAPLPVRLTPSSCP
jgi:hypothetical protein